MLRKILLGCGVISSVLYIAVDVLGSLRYPGYSYADQEFSELTAQDSPVRPLMVALNAVPYTLLVGAFAGGVWTSAEPKRSARITAAMLAGYSFSGMVTGVFFPMKPREALAAGEATLRNVMHIPGTIVMSLFMVLAMGFGARLLGRRFRYYTYATIGILVVFGVLTSLQAGRLEENQPTPWMGIEERINIYATMLWVAVLAIGLLRDQEAR
jgi:amino acid transporter